MGDIRFRVKGLVYCGNIGIMAKRNATTIMGDIRFRFEGLVYWENVGIIEKRMETTIVYWGYLWIATLRNPPPRCGAVIALTDSLLSALCCAICRRARDRSHFSHRTSGNKRAELCFH